MKKVFIAGHQGMVGSAIVRRLRDLPDVELLLRTRNDLDLSNQSAVYDFFRAESIDEVYLAAAKVGGIHANKAYPAEFIFENLSIECNVIHASHLTDVNRLLFLGSSCIYPKMADQPLVEAALLTGPLEPTNESYAIAKIAGIKLCEAYNRQYSRDYRSIMPTNLYGPNDNFHPKNSHVIPGLLRRFHEAKVNNIERVVAWGSGTPKREFLHVDDLADAAIYVMQLDKDRYQENTEPALSHINVGTGKDCSIRELVETIAQIVGYNGVIAWDTSQPDGTPRKLLNVDKLRRLGWKHRISLEEGMNDTYQWFLNNLDDFRD